MLVKAFVGERASAVQAEFRLKENRDFRRVFQRGKSVAAGRFILYWYENRFTSQFRVGFSVSKKVGDAVTRNLVKRRLRDCFQRYSPFLLESRCDFVVVCRKHAASATFEEIQTEIGKLLRKAKFMV